MTGGTHAATARAGIPARAVVCAAGVDTTYLRAGRGEPIVLVVEDVEATDVREMIDSLSRGFLVIAAAPAAASIDRFGGWLRDFLEGLGVSDAHVLLHQSLATILLTDSNHA